MARPARWRASLSRHIDPEVARQNGFDRPILHGLCTLGIAARELAAHIGCHPADLTQLSARLSAPVMPGQTLTVLSAGTSDSLHRMAEELVTREKVDVLAGVLYSERRSRPFCESPIHERRPQTGAHP